MSLSNHSHLFCFHVGIPLVHVYLYMSLSLFFIIVFCNSQFVFSFFLFLQSQADPVVLSYAELNASLAAGILSFEDFPSFTKPVIGNAKDKENTIAVLVKASNLISLDSVTKANPLVALVDAKGKLIDHTGLEL